MKLESVYINCSNFQKSVLFYEKLLNMKPKIFTEDRYVIFECGNRVCLYNQQYDIDFMKTQKEISNNFSNEYIEDFKLKSEQNKMNNIIILNFYTDNLKNEYERLKQLNIGEVSKIMYVNITEPYYYFNIKDPDGNELEIYGNDYN